jgi:hypothetical protein
MVTLRGNPLKRGGRRNSGSSVMVAIERIIASRKQDD